MTNEIKTFTNNTGSTLKVEMIETKNEKVKRFTVSIPKESYEKNRVAIEPGGFFGEDYGNMIDKITGVYIEDGVLRIEGFIDID
ncbi:hypothetical protein [Bacillus wiedmannii]|uniref:hypothetical protein n=1 Tax=Bacillus wiedmannii TaxID=1890302 RepID=UPI000BFDD827|nr:hypothetical protein [Bacillus wiedmannii]PHE75146.1 hypothetical protein COF77_15290 [Bacillus wiedmannii]